MDLPYGLREESDGTWTVFVVQTGDPAVMNDVPMVGLSLEEAVEMVELFNLIDKQSRTTLNDAP